MKRIIACLMAGVMLLALVGCGASGSSGSASSAAKKDYTHILHDARSDEDNEYEMIFTKGEDGKFTAQYGYSAYCRSRRSARWRPAMRWSAPAACGRRASGRTILS